MLFCQDWIDRRATRSNLAKPQTFPLEKPRGSNSGLRCSLVFWWWLTVVTAQQQPQPQQQNNHNCSWVETK